MGQIIVTGATGQIGSELVIALKAKFGSESVVAAGHRRKPKASIFRRIPFELIDVTKKEEVEAAIEKYDIDTIYHLAAVLSAVGEKNPQRAWHVNVEGLHNMLLVAEEHKVAKVFWPSSVAVFGPKVPRLNTPQDACLTPITMYGITKVAGELLCNYFFTRYGLDVRSLRYPGIISSETPPGGGTTDYAVDMFYRAITESKYTCFVSEDTVLPMMYMPDCIKAAIDLMETPRSKINGFISYNITGFSFSAGELAAEIQRYVPSFRCTYKPDFRQNIADSWPMTIDDTLAQRDWEWKPRYDLASMTRDMINRVKKKLAIN